MMELGTALAVVAFADQCLKYGNKFVKRCKSYLHAEEEAVELLVSIESNWVKMETQIEILKRVAGGLNKRLQNMQSQILSQLEGKLKTASLIIEQMLSEKRENEKAKKGERKHDDQDIATVIKGLGEMRASKKAKYVSKKSTLYQIVDEIEKWQARYDPTWILIMQMSIGNIDKELHEQQKKPQREQIPIIVAAKGVRDATRATHGENVGDQGPIWIDHLNLKPSSIPHSPIQLSALKDEKETVLIDTMVCNPAANVDKTAKEVRNLARILAEVDPSTFSLLRCRGVIKAASTRDSSPRGPPHPDFKFIFNIPAQLSNPQSLRTVLLSRTSYPLDERLDLAKRLASSILFVHTVQFVHKNIRPETIVIFQNERSQIGAPFLAGFEQFRVEDGKTYRAGDDIWQHNLYRHPSRQGTHPEVDYEMQHDIYSLGVVLLEIGLWTSFVLYSPDEESSSPVPNKILEPIDLVSPPKSLYRASQNKLNLEDLAAKELPARLGRRYTDIVLLCLRCLDAGSGANQDGKVFDVDAADLTDEDGVIIGVRYIENVLEKIQEITLEYRLPSDHRLRLAEHEASASDSTHPYRPSPRPSSKPLQDRSGTDDLSTGSRQTPSLNNPSQSSCAASRMRITTPASFRNSSDVYTIVTVPHPYTLITLQNGTDAISINILGSGRGGLRRFVSLKNAIASRYIVGRSLWKTVEQLPALLNKPPPSPKLSGANIDPVITSLSDDWLEDLDWHFGFPIPCQTIQHSESIPPVPGPERWPMGIPRLPVEKEKRSSNLDPPAEQQMALKVELLGKARDDSQE